MQKIDYFDGEKAVAVSGTGTTTVVMCNDVTSALARLLADLDNIGIARMVGGAYDRVPLSDQDHGELSALRKAMFGY